jgi:hypothetical protein
MSTLACWLLGHDPELVEWDPASARAAWDCRRHCGWTFHEPSSGPIPLELGGHRLLAIVVPAVVVVIAVGLVWLGVSVPYGTPR